MFAMSILFFIHTSMNNLKFIVSESLSFETVIYKQYDRLDSLPQFMSCLTSYMWLELNSKIFEIKMIKFLSSYLLYHSIQS